ncbi:MAG: FeoB-associated Cys-rich membrane protein [Anaerotignum sp.]|nr:FeoB-associated Cys-rich membrane protein [Anaerotignum sp.]
MTNILILGIIGLILGGAAGYIWNEKKKGRKCIGCPYSNACSGSCGGCEQNRGEQGGAL